MRLVTASWLVHLNLRLGACTVILEPLLAAVETVRPDHLWQPEKWGGVGSVLPWRMLEVPRAAEVVLRPRAADRRPLFAVEVELDLALAPPAVVVSTMQRRS